MVLAAYRTQLFNPADIDNVKKIQAGYKVQPLSAFLGQPAPAAAPAIDFIKPLTAADERKSLEFFNILNFILQFTPTVPSETELMARFAKIGVGAGKTFDPSSLSPEIKTAIEQGVADAWADLASVKKEIDAGTVTSGELFGTREYLKNNYLYRMAGAVLGIYGNSKQEAMYPVYAVDAAGQKLDGANRYTVHFAAGAAPAGQRLLVADDVRSAPEPARGQSDQSLPAQFADAAAVREGRRRRPDVLCPERVAGQGQGAELAACTQGAILHRDAPLLAEGSRARRLLEKAADGESGLASCRFPDANEVVMRGIQ